MTRLLYSGILIFSIMVSCTVRKDQDDPSFLNKLYHNTTARYNGYYNADLLMKESMAALNQEYIEDYDTLIPVYPYMVNPNVENQFNTLDKVIEKVTTISALHRQSHWLDDNYFMLGKANFLKKNYKEAGAAFSYLVNNFDPVSPNDDIREENKERTRGKSSRKEYKKREKDREERRKEINKLRKKQQKKARKSKGKKQRPVRTKETETPLPAQETTNEPLLASAATTPEPENTGGLMSQSSNPDDYFLKHKPIYQEGLLWEARTWAAQENYFSAEARLSMIINDPNTAANIRLQAMIAIIDSYVKSNKHKRAVQVIDQVLDENIDQQQKIRLAFLAGQIESQNRSNQNAVSYFEKVLQLRPEEYEKDFYARLNIARLQGGDLIGKFQDLLKNPNNAPYKGEIYYIMGETYRGNYDFQRAIDAYSKVEDPENNANPATKAKAFLAAADIYYNEETYANAKKYYEMAIGLLSPENRHFPRAKERSEKLTIIASAEEAIQYQDSLLTIAGYTDAQKKDLALKIKKERQKEQTKNTSTAAGNTANSTTGSRVVNRIGSAGGAQSTFFAYDEKSIKQGERNFKRKWGDRALADNWRYSSAGGAIAIDDSDADSRTISLGITETEIEEILQDVPKNPEEVLAVNNTINESLLKMGFSFRSDLNKLDKSNETLIRLIDRAPDKEIHAEALYLLFINAREAGNNAMATQYKRQFDSQFSSTKFGEKIRTSTTVMGQDDVAESALEQVRKDFENGDYEKVLQLSDKSKTMFNNKTELLAQFAMLEAMATGKIKGREEYITKLQYLVANYPKTKEGAQARDYLQVLGAEVKTDITRQATSSDAFSSQIENTPHYILLPLTENEQVNPLKSSISDFNREYFQNDNISITTVQVATESGNKPALLVRRFGNKEEAMNYYRVAEKNKNKFANGITIELLPLAITNYRFLVSENKLPEYKLFLQKEYGILF